MALRFRAVGVLLVAVVVTGAAVGAGMLLHSPDEAPAPVRPLATPLASLDAATAVVRREAWCDRMPAGDVRAAVHDDSPQLTIWSNGDPLGSSRDVAHEFGCSWKAASGEVASGWVFAPPVTVQRGQELLASARARRGCAPLTGAAAFGSPSLALSCAAGGMTTISYRGLFGDAWLVCELSAPTGANGAGLAQLADRWCASVLTAAGPGAAGD